MAVLLKMLSKRSRSTAAWSTPLLQCTDAEMFPGTAAARLTPHSQEWLCYWAESEAMWKRERAALHKFQCIADAQRLAGFRRSDARIGGHAIKMVEALRRRPRRQRRAPMLGEPLLKSGPVRARLRIARRHRTPRARIAALE